MKAIFRIGNIALSALFFLGCHGERYTQISTTPQKTWQQAELSESFLSNHGEPVEIYRSQYAQNIEGFGACFNELGWDALGLLSDSLRVEVMAELFGPNVGANFTICRVPVGANDFSRDWYSYNETTGDFAMSHFSIARDTLALIPFIKAAQAQNPDLQFWASPWCPPSWMKHNKHYASAYTGDEVDEKYRNGLAKHKAGREGTDMFIQDSTYMKAYALYFKKYVQAYRDAGIPIFTVMPQNEFNSAQIFPSCCWTPKGLATFIGQYLGPAMADEQVGVMLGTVERADWRLVDTVLQDTSAAKYIQGVGFQWAGKAAVEVVHEAYPEMTLYQTEQECGDGKNDWAGVEHAWSLLKHYFDSGVSAYMYWNIALEKGGVSRWGWAQNSLVVVDAETRTYKFTPEYYLMKHFSHFVRPDATYLVLKNAPDCMAFENQDGSIVLLCMEKRGQDRILEVSLDGDTDDIKIQANSINTIIWK